MWGALGTVFLRETFYLQSLCHLVSQENILTHFASLLPLKGEPGRNGSPGEVGFSGSPVSLFGSTQSTHVGLPLTAHVTQVPAERAFRRDDGELTPTLPVLGAGKDGLGGRQGRSRRHRSQQLRPAVGVYRPDVFVLCCSHVGTLSWRENSLTFFLR